MGGSLFIVVIVLVVLALILWPIISGFGSKAAGQTDTRGGALADQERPDLQLATAVVGSANAGEEVDEKQFPLHAVHPGARNAVCGVEVAKVLDGTTWPPDPAAACSACADALTAGGSPPPRDATR